MADQDSASPAPVARTPLAGAGGPSGGPHDAGVVLAEVTGNILVNLRGDPSARPFRDGVRKILGTPPPSEPNTVAAAEHARILWLGPDEWLAAARAPHRDTLASDLDAALAGTRHSTVDLSDNYAVIHLSGPKARWVLAKGWANDLHPGAFAPGQCAQALLGHAQIILDHSAPDSYTLYVRPSFVAYLWAWLVDAACDVGHRIVR